MTRKEEKLMFPGMGPGVTNLIAGERVLQMMNDGEFQAALNNPGHISHRIAVREWKTQHELAYKEDVQ